VAKAFNHAIDLFCYEDDVASKRWIAKALEIAHCCADDGALERVLHDKLVQMRFGLGD
jgi:hypothetical protein